MADSEAPVNFANYCACFIDLLGQKRAMEGETILPAIHTENQRQALIKRVKASVGKIVGVHGHAEHMLNSMRELRDPPEPLNDAQLAQWRAMREERTVTQRWSDGLMVFACLGDVPLCTQVNSVYSQFCLAGAMCLLGLAAKAPMRGGSDIAWGVELYPNELYGPAVANAYALESACAEYPRIVVGEEVDRYLLAVTREPGNDIPLEVARQFATRCPRMLSRDEQGVLFLDYLSSCFEESVTSTQIEPLWKSAREFIDSELTAHMTSGDEKLAARYRRLAGYFDSRPPLSCRAGAG